jgi:tight adherence protein B
VSTTILLAAVGATALFVFVFVIFAPGAGSGLLSRLESFEEPVVVAAPQQHTARLDIFRQGIQATVGKKLDRSDRGTKLADGLARANLKIRPTEWVMISAGASLLAGALAYLRFNSTLAIPAGLLIGYVGMQVFLRMRQTKRTKAFDGQLSPTILAMSSAMKAGYTFAQAMDLVSKNTPPPMGSELSRVTREIQLGVPINEALGHMVKRNDSEDLRLMLTAVQIQSQVGGNLSSILDTIEFTIRERIRIKGEIKTLTGQARASGWVLIILPFALGGLLMAIAPSYFNPMWQKLPGQIMLGVAGFMLLCGYGLIRKIVNVKI